MQPLGGAGHPALIHYGAKDAQLGQIHISLHEIIFISIIHFM